MENIASKNYVERFCPNSFSSFVLPQRIKNSFSKDENDPLTQSMLFYGLQGSGKSSLAKFLGKKYNFLYVNASINGKIDYLREIVNEFCESYQIPTDLTINTSKKVVLFDEINGASDSFFEGLKGFMDTYPEIIFLATTNHFNKIPDPIKSRMLCVPFNFQNQTEEDEVKSEYVRRIAKIISVIGCKIDAKSMEKVIDKCFPDFRKTLNLLQSIQKAGIVEINESNLNVFEHRFKEVYDLIVNGDVMHPEEIHKILSSDYASCAFELITSLDEEFIAYLSENNKKLLVNIPTICITVAEALTRIQNSVDPSITLKACIFTLMTNMKR